MACINGWERHKFSSETCIRCGANQHQVLREQWASANKRYKMVHNPTPLATKKDPLAAGYEDRYHGVKCNPHPENSPEAALWQEGFDAAREDQAKGITHVRRLKASFQNHQAPHNQSGALEPDYGRARQRRMQSVSQGLGYSDPDLCAASSPASTAVPAERIASIHPLDDDNF